jgi:hypothetical protein
MSLGGAVDEVSQSESYLSLRRLSLSTLHLARPQHFTCQIPRTDLDLVHVDADAEVEIRQPYSTENNAMLDIMVVLPYSHRHIEYGAGGVHARTNQKGCQRDPS